jgi:hypothetical protein
MFSFSFGTRVGYSVCVLHFAVCATTSLVARFLSSFGISK